MNKGKGLTVFCVFICVIFFITNANCQEPVQWNQVVPSGFGIGNEDVNCVISFKGYLYAASVEHSTVRSYLWRTSDGINWVNIDIGSMGVDYIKTMGVFNDYLYAGIGKTTGAELWRSVDGVNWEIIINNGFDTSNINIYSMQEFEGNFYIGTWCNSGGQIWRSSDGLIWEKVNTNGFGNSQNVAIFALGVFEGYLYAGTDKWTNGCEVWRSENGTHWERVVANGFGNSSYNDAVTDFEEFDGSIYVSTMTYANGFEVWKSSDGVSWVMAAPKGFGDPVNYLAINTWCYFKNYMGGLYAFTALSRNLIDGAQVWRTFDGAIWERVSDYGFGNPHNNKFFAIDEFDGFLYVGTHNMITGCEVWTDSPPIIQVDIDVKPGSYPNSINLGSNGNVPVAIFSTEDFDATTVDPLTVALAGAEVKIKGKGTPMTSAKDIDGDGLLDLVVHVNTTALQLSMGDTEAILEGQTFDGIKIRGSDTVRIVNE